MAVNSTLRFSGIASGLDTDTIISQLMQIERAPVDKAYQKKQVLEWKRDAYREMTTLLKGFETEYLDVLSSTNMRAQASYKKFSATAMGSTGSTSNVVSAVGSVNASAGTHTIHVDSIATAEELKSSTRITKSVEASRAVNWANAQGKDFKMTVDGVTKTINVGATVSTVGELQDLVDNAFGENKISVTESALNYLSFSVVDGSGVNKFTLSAGTNDALDLGIGFGGASNKSNRISTSDTLADLADKTQTTFAFNATDEVVLTINGEEFTFDSDTTLNSVMNEVNSNSTANVYMRYDELSDTIKFVSKQTGVGANVEISETGSTFLSAINIDNSVTGTSQMANIATMDYSAGTGTNKKFTVNIDGVTKEITLDTDYSGDLDYSTNLLTDIKSKIETAFSLYSVSVTVSEASGYLGINLDAGGNTISFGDPISDGDTSALSDLGLQAAYVSGQDASVVLDGETITRSNNSFTVDGVTYTVLGESTVGQDDTVTLSLDVDTVYDNIVNFVGKYNEIIATINAKLDEDYDRDYQPLTDEQKDSMSDDEIERWETKAKTGLIKNDSILENIVSKFRIAMYDEISGVASTLSSIGISTGAYTDKGKLYIDETKLKAAIQNDSDSVMDLFSRQSTTQPSYSRTMSTANRTARYNEEGIVQRIYDIIQDNISTIRDSDSRKGFLLQKAGMVTDVSEYSNDLYDQITDWSERISDLEDSLYDKEDAYYRKFAALESAMQRLNSQGSWLAQQLGAG